QHRGLLPELAKGSPRGIPDRELALHGGFAGRTTGRMAWVGGSKLRILSIHAGPVRGLLRTGAPAAFRVSHGSGDESAGRLAGVRTGDVRLPRKHRAARGVCQSLPQ